MPDDQRETWSRQVSREIAAKNPWYVGSQFEWAEHPRMRRIYARRFRYLRDGIERVRARRGSPLRVLDAGCGDGYWLARLATLPEVALVGLDYNELRVERARQVAPAADVRVGDLANLDRRETFDVVLLNQVIEHVEDDQGLLRRLRPLVRPGGMLILGTTNEGSWLQQQWLRRTGTIAHTDHVHFYTEGEIREKIERAGFAVETVMREAFFPGSYRLYYALTRRGWGFRLLELLTRLLPSQSSDFYFACRPLETSD